MQYRKKPVVIDAIQFDGTPGGAVAVFEVFEIPGAKFVPFYDLTMGHIMIPTLEGNMLARGNDWIIRGVQGEFYPCRSDIFEATYDVVPPSIDITNPDSLASTIRSSDPEKASISRP